MKLRKLLLLVCILNVEKTLAASMLYQFNGVITGTSGSGADVFTTDYGVELGVTTVSYLFEIDFDRDVGGFSNSTQTVNYFYVDLIGDSVAFNLLNGISAEEYRGYDIDFVNFFNTGQLRAGNVVTITTNRSETPLWRVEDWVEGQSFRFNDGTLPPTGGAALYLTGEVHLSSIRQIPEAKTSGLAGLTGIMLLSLRRRAKKPNKSSLPTGRSSTVTTPITIS